MVSPELLSRCALFAALPPPALAQIAKFCDEVALPPHSYLFEQKRPSDKLFLLLEGTVDLLMDMDEDGVERSVVERLVADDVVGWSALVEPHRYKLSAVAASGMKAISINALKLREYLAANPEYGYSVVLRVAHIIGERLSHMRTRFLSMAD